MILVIDDDAAAADAIARTLRETGREVRIASTVPDALAMLAAETPSAVVLDPGLAADRPADPGGPAIYRSTDTGAVEIWDGGAWRSMGGGGGGGAPTPRAATSW